PGQRGVSGRRRCPRIKSPRTRAVGIVGLPAPPGTNPESGASAFSWSLLAGLGRGARRAWGGRGARLARVFIRRLGRAGLLASGVLAWLSGRRLESLQALLNTAVGQRISAGVADQGLPLFAAHPQHRLGDGDHRGNDRVVTRGGSVQREEGLELIELV